VGLDDATWVMDSQLAVTLPHRLGGEEGIFEDALEHRSWDMPLHVSSSRTVSSTPYARARRPGPTYTSAA
jgi:hypothetical protein